MNLRFLSSSKSSIDFKVLAVFLAVVFLLGGGARADIASLVLLRPLSVVLAGWWILRLDRAALSRHRWFLLFAGVTFGLLLLHMIPLPPSLWQSLPQRDLVERIDAAVGLGEVWRPLTLAPDAARNALWSLFVPFAVGLGMLRLDGRERRTMLAVVLGLGAMSLALSLLQVFAPSASVLWFYRVTNNGSPVGLFANRNHAAVFLAALLPLATAWAMQQGDEKRAVLKRTALVVAVVLVGLVELVSGSRAGIVAYGAAILASVLLLPTEWKPARRRAKAPPAFLGRPRRSALIAVVAFGALLVALLLLLGGQATALSRLFDSGTGDFRPMFWRRTTAMIGEYFPLGSGSASFVEAYRAGELPGDVMRSYANHAHNDYLEIALTLGIPGILLVAAILAFIVFRLLAAWRIAPVPGSNVRLARAAGAALVIFAGASIVDYPLRVPSLSAFAVVALFWLVSPRSAGRDSS
ncbi:O-antigen ligase family protein [Tsuneonella amylolytica]|uniref:O-antigen ligase family protein n=1 Tax=Tsuneonella amylolytica TaxID=2338327 RepID=UPI000EAAB276|nr:O-antigen ligase family protein [Tsuneonella amylolytica]